MEEKSMNFWKKGFIALIALTLTVSLAACSTGQPASSDQSSAPASTSPAAVTSPAATQSAAPADSAQAKRTQYPFTYTTYNFEKQPIQVTVKKAPQRVYAQDQDNIEILLALGQGDKIVGCSGLDGDIRPDLADAFSKVNYYKTFPGKEAVLGLNPDFIAGWYSTFGDDRLGDVDFWNNRGVGTYMALNSACRGPADKNPQTVDDEMQDILTLGQIFDAQDKAEAIVKQIKDELAKIQDYIKGKTPLTVAVLEDQGGSYRVYGEDVLGGNVAMQAGAKLAVGKHGQNGTISAEDLIAANPDAIFMVWYDDYTVGNTPYNGDNVVKLITDNPAFASLSAVKNHRVFAINLSGIYCSGMRTLDGVLDFAHNLYPDLYRK